METPLAPNLIIRTAESFGRIFDTFSFDHSLFILLAAVPAIAWLILFLFFHRQKKWWLFITFAAGMFSVIPIFILKYEIHHIDGWFDGFGLSTIGVVLLSSLWIGVYEEIAKHWVVKKVDRKLFTDIDDAILFSVVAALGFSFLENIIYFANIWNNPAIDNFWGYWFLRSIGSMFLHVFASGVFGYFYGVAYFAKDVLRDELAVGRKFIFTKTFHKIFHFKSETIFAEEKILEGVLIAAGIHGLFDFAMETSSHLKWNWLPVITILATLAIGLTTLMYLFDLKENHKKFGRLKTIEDDILD